LTERSELANVAVTGTTPAMNPYECSMPQTASRLLTLTTQIAMAYVEGNAVDAAAVPRLIRDIHRSLADLSSNSVGEAKEFQSPETRPTGQPAVEIRKSVFADHLVCLEDGLKATMLKRHLRTAHNLTPEQYRAKWGLPATYPMVAPNYTKVRSRLAKEAGLGRGGRPPK
jgi:predicted transcriptional regulator